MTNDDVPGIQPLLDILYQHGDRRLAEVRDGGLQFAHYTTAETALEIIAGRSVWLRNAAVMNDHSEIEHGRAILSTLLEGPVGRRLCAALDAVHDGVSNTVRAHFYQDAHDARETTYMTSMCEHGPTEWFGRLSMWRAYGGPRAGAAIVLKPGVVTDPSLNLGLYPSPVLYGDASDVAVELGAVADALERAPGAVAAVDADMVAHVVAGALHFAMLSIKHRGFEEEREWRILCPARELSPDRPVRRVVRSVAGIPQLVCELPLHGKGGTFLPQLTWENMLERIIVGPSLHPEVVKRAFEAELQAQDVSRWDQIVELSEIPLRQPG